MLPRVPRDLRVSLVRTLTRVMIDYGLKDIEEPDYLVLADELCETIRDRKETEAGAPASC